MQSCDTPVLDLQKPTAPTVSVYSRFPESISLVFSKLGFSSETQGFLVNFNFSFD